MEMRVSEARWRDEGARRGSGRQQQVQMPERQAQTGPQTGPQTPPVPTTIITQTLMLPAREGLRREQREG